MKRSSIVFLWLFLAKCATLFGSNISIDTVAPRQYFTWAKLMYTKSPLEKATFYRTGDSSVTIALTIEPLTQEEWRDSKNLPLRTIPVDSIEYLRFEQRGGNGAAMLLGGIVGLGVGIGLGKAIGRGGNGGLVPDAGVPIIVLAVLGLPIGVGAGALLGRIINPKITITFGGDRNRYRKQRSLLKQFSITGQ